VTPGAPTRTSAAQPPARGTEAARDLVSVVIPCYNQGRFLADALESALGQTYRAVEVVVVDDGSTDDTAAVVARYPPARRLRQENRGLAAARNRGLAESAGAYVVFLDADDRLLPGAIETNLSWLAAHPGHAMVFGDHRYIDEHGRVLREWTVSAAEGDPYARLLTGNVVGMVGTALYGRRVFDEVGGFEARWNPCEDYDLYLRIARRFPVGSHPALVAEYRRYGTAMSDDPRRMLRAAVGVLRAQARFVRGRPELEAAYAAGLAHWRAYYAEPLAARLRRRWAGGEQRLPALRDALTLLRYAPRTFARLLAGRVATGEAAPRP
jgi:glycosyltransferase involved in cell wall biosynthesis